MKVAAADAAEPERAGVPACGDVAGLGASSVGGRDLADRTAGMLGIQQNLGLPPDAVPMPVELHDRDPLDRLAPAFLAD